MIFAALVAASCSGRIDADANPAPPSGIPKGARDAAGLSAQPVTQVAQAKGPAPFAAPEVFDESVETQYEDDGENGIESVVSATPSSSADSQPPLQ